MQKERTTERKEAAASAKEKKIPVPARMTVEHGLRQLAFGDISDAVRLIFGPPGEPEELEKMNLFNISEIRRGKDGLVEIKLYDRMEAMRCLEERKANREEVLPLYQALQRIARFLPAEGAAEKGSDDGGKA